MPEVDPNSWAAIIREFFDGMPKLLGGIKDVVLAVGVLYGAWSAASTSGKLDVAAAKADAAATGTAEVKQELKATTTERQATLATMQHTDLTTAAMVAAVKAELTKDPDDMNTAKMAKTRLEEHKFPAPVTP